MQSNHWFARAVRLGLVGAVALAGAAAYAQEKEDKKADDAKSAAKVEDGSRFDIRVPENAPGRQGRGPRPSEYWLGLEAYPAQDALRTQLDLPAGQGLVIEQVVPESPAAKAGLKRHDVLLAANDKPLKDLPDLVQLVAEGKDKEISFKLLRGGKMMTVAATPGKRPEGQVPEVPERDNRIFDWIRQRGGEPLRMRFFHPGMVLPPGAPGHRKFPDDLSITITKEGDKPASVEVKKGDQSWKVSSDDLAELPESVRGFAEELLGRGPFNFHFNVQGPEIYPAPPLPGPPGPPSNPGRPGGPAVDRSEERLEKQLDEMHQRLQELREQMKDLRGRRGPRSDQQPDRPGPAPEKRPEA